MAVLSDPSEPVNVRVTLSDVFRSGINQPVTVRVTLSDGRVGIATDATTRRARAEAIRLALEKPIAPT